MNTLLFDRTYLNVNIPCNDHIVFKYSLLQGTSCIGNTSPLSTAFFHVNTTNSSQLHGLSMQDIASIDTCLNCRRSRVSLNLQGRSLTETVATLSAVNNRACNGIETITTTTWHGKWSCDGLFAPALFCFHFDHVRSSLAICVSPNCSNQHQLRQQRPCHVLSCLCDNACKGSLAICRKNRALCPVSRLLYVHI